MCFKVFVSFAVVLFTYCNASTLPEPLDAETSPKVFDPETSPKVFDPETSPKVFDTETSPKVFDPETSPKVFDPETSPKVFDTETSPKVFEPETSPKKFDTETSPKVFDADTSSKEFDSETSPKVFDTETSRKEFDTETSPKVFDAETSSKPLEPTHLPKPFPTTNPVEGSNIQQCGETTNEFGDASRVTCDIFASQPLCAAHCRLLGHSDGYCNSKKVCICGRVQNDERAPCGGGCITSSQCAAYAGTTNCRCAWFGCNLYTAAADLTDVEQFEAFIADYSGNPVMISSAEKAFRKRQ